MLLRICFALGLMLLFFAGNSPQNCRNVARNYLVIKHFDRIVNKEDVARRAALEQEFLPAVSLAQAALKKVALYSPLEKPLRHRHHYSNRCRSLFGIASVSLRTHQYATFQTAFAKEPAFFKEFADGCFAAEPFYARKRLHPGKLFL